jgi:8-oxo-dGTP pyrophosphatase MutT (NUDIX family)
MMNRWRKLLLQAVSPLDEGVKGLDVYGFNPLGHDVYRPSRTAAVLVPLLDLDVPQVVFTRRADHHAHHPGQVSFPGGAAEEGDESAVRTAIREAREEIGLDENRVRPLGFLDRMDTVSDYRVLPVVALVDPPVKWVPDPTEVAEVFTVPLTVVLERSHYQKESYVKDGVRRSLYALRWDGYRIWGVTAGILINLIDRFQAAHDD